MGEALAQFAATLEKVTVSDGEITLPADWSTRRWVSLWSADKTSGLNLAQLFAALPVAVLIAAE